MDDDRHPGRAKYRSSPASPAVWSKWPWLHTMAWMSAGLISKRRMFSTTPFGLPSASNSACRRASPFLTVTKAENPCSATSASGTCQSVITAHGIVGLACRVTRWAAPWSGMNRSSALSITVVAVTAFHRLQHDLIDRPEVMQHPMRVVLGRLIHAHPVTFPGAARSRDDERTAASAVPIHRCQSQAGALTGISCVAICRTDRQAIVIRTTLPASAPPR
jgi:hypothetical protein